MAQSPKMLHGSPRWHINGFVGYWQVGNFIDGTDSLVKSIVHAWINGWILVAGWLNKSRRVSWADK